MACLDENEVAALLEHQLGEADLARIDDHVAGCAACRRWVTELERPGTTAIAFAATEPAAEKRDLGPLTEALARTHAERRLGTTLAEKWTLERVLGVGGMAQVFAATHRNGKKVAMKVLRPELGSDPSILKRFLQEGYAANKVEHPGAVSVLDDGIADDGSAFLVMDLLDGETLGQRLASEGRLGVGEVTRVTHGILEVLGAAHDKGIVHRDIKPENVFLERGGGVRLLDFGIARVRELTRERGGTEAGSILGTPSFMPPEQARGRWDEVDARSDLWAVGATMYTLLTGEPVRRAKTLNEELLAAMTAPVPPIRRALPALDPAIARVIDRALALDRTARFSSAREMQDALREAASHVGAPGKRLSALGVGALALAILGGVAVVTRPDAGVPRAEARNKAGALARARVVPPAEVRTEGDAALPARPFSTPVGSPPVRSSTPRAGDTPSSGPTPSRPAADQPTSTIPAAPPAAQPGPPSPDTPPGTTPITTPVEKLPPPREVLDRRR